MSSLTWWTQSEQSSTRRRCRTPSLSSASARLISLQWMHLTATPACYETRMDMSPSGTSFSLYLFNTLRQWVTVFFIICLVILVSIFIRSVSWSYSSCYFSCSPILNIFPKWNISWRHFSLLHWTVGLIYLVAVWATESFHNVVLFLSLFVCYHSWRWIKVLYMSLILLSVYCSILDALQPTKCGCGLEIAWVKVKFSELSHAWQLGGMVYRAQSLQQHIMWDCILTNSNGPL